MKWSWIRNTLAEMLGGGHWRQCDAHKYVVRDCFVCCVRGVGHPGSHKAGDGTRFKEDDSPKILWKAAP